MDFIIYLSTYEGLGIVFIIIDRFSKYIVFPPCKAICIDPELAGVFYDHIVCKFGITKKDS